MELLQPLESGVLALISCCDKKQVAPSYSFHFVYFCRLKFSMSHSVSDPADSLLLIGRGTITVARAGAVARHKLQIHRNSVILFSMTREVRLFSELCPHQGLLVQPSRLPRQAIQLFCYTAPGWRVVAEQPGKQISTNKRTPMYKLIQNRGGSAHTPPTPFIAASWSLTSMRGRIEECD